ncbi:CHAP domain-containing protein [Microbacterium foliorum]|uniref:CHAP domain-containing protein n=1 Tax=Rothia terrae TaxID=396015 RepID=UPI0034235A33
MSTPAENQDSNTLKWVIGAAITLVGLLIAAIALFPVSFLFFFGNADSNGLNNSCYSAESISNAVAGSDGITSQPKLGATGYTEEQLNNARIIDKTAADLGLSGKASEIAITAAFGESTLFNLDYGDEGAGVKNPDGSATTSKGLFQQQTSTGWGTIEQVTDPVYATTSFLTGQKHNGIGGGLVSIAGWETMERTQAIHRVQANADPTHYARFYSNADEVMDIIKVDRNRPADESKQEKWKKGNLADSKSADVITAGNSTTNCNSTSKEGKAVTVAGKEAKNTYAWGEYGDGGIVTPPGSWKEDPMGFYYGECTSFVSWKLNEDMGGTKDNIIFNNMYGGHKKGNGYEWKAAWEASGWKVSNVPVPGAVAWWGQNGAEGVGSSGHVAYVADVTDDGKAIIEEYNNSYYAPPGHKYNVRPQPVDPSQVNAFLYPPPKNA